MITEILLTLFYAVILLLIVRKWRLFRLESIHVNVVTALFMVKLVAGIVFCLIYSNYYSSRATSDSMKFFDDSLVFIEALKHNPLDYFRMLFGVDTDQPQIKEYFHNMNNWYLRYDHDLFNTNRTIIRFNAIANLFSFGHIYVNTMFMCFLSFTGLTLTYKAFRPWFESCKYELLIAVFLVPSTIFWSSGLLKEGLAVFQFGIIFYSFFLLFKYPKNPGYWALLLSGLYLMNMTKIYFLVALLPVLVAYALVKISSDRFIFWKYLIVVTGYFTALINLYHFIPTQNFLRKLYLKQEGFYRISEYWKADSTIELPPLEDNLISVLKNTPQALAHLFFRPHIFEAYSPFILLAGLENLGILVFVVICIIHVKKKYTGNEKNLFLFLLFIILINYAIIGLVTPVMGAFVRYKSPVLPLLLIMLLLILDKEKLLKRFQAFKSKFRLT